MGNCCAGEAENHGCCAVPEGSCKGRAAQITGIVGLITAIIFLIVNFIYSTLWIAGFLIHIGLPSAGVGIYLGKKTINQQRDVGLSLKWT